MKKTLKRLGALALVLCLVLALSSVAWADATLTNGVAGAFTDYDSANPTTTGDASKTNLDRSINFTKELVSINANGTTVKAPAFSYVYTVTPATVADGTTVTDAAVKHATNTAVTVPVKAGITTGLVVTGTAAGAAGTATEAIGSLVFTNSTDLTSTADGTGTGVNSYSINLNFTNVTFTQPGVYRYQITESLGDSATYEGIAIKDGGANALYMDVYVDGSGNIYGYVCMTSNETSETPSSTNKVNGFTSANADTYYTYDFTISKDVVNDTYAEANTAFPFTVIFNNSESYTTTYAIGETAGTGSTGISPAAAAPTWSGVAMVKDGGAITYTGIPAGVDVDVYETNIATGVTYTVETSVNGGAAVTDNNVSWGSTPASAVAQTTKAAYESTKATVDTTKYSAPDATQTIGITNTLVLISPTGVVLRVAPYILILAAGVVLLVLSRRRKMADDEA